MQLVPWGLEAILYEVSTLKIASWDLLHFPLPLPLQHTGIGCLAMSGVMTSEPRTTVLTPHQEALNQGRCLNAFHSWIITVYKLSISNG